VLAAGSGVGQAAIQVARLHGARVFATAGSDAKLERARALGASAVIHHHREGYRGGDQAFDEPPRRRCRHRTRRGSDVAEQRTIAGAGRTPGHVRRDDRRERAIDLRALFAKQLTLHGSYMGTKGELLEAAPLFFAGELKPVVDDTFPLAEAAAAQRRLEQSEQFGKIVLEIG
jgi:NADPH:quinone reductase-like Zn-dependent oxidoreductase